MYGNTSLQNVTHPKNKDSRFDAFPIHNKILRDDASFLVANELPMAKASKYEMIDVQLTDFSIYLRVN